MLRPHYGKAHFNMGRLHMMENNEEEAWKCFKYACTRADLDTSNIGFETYGALSVRLGKMQDAITAYEKLVSLYPQNTNYHLQLAVAYATNQQHQKAIPIYEHINKSVSDERSWYHLAESYIAIQEHAKALNCYSHVTTTKENAANIAYKKALCYEQLNDIPTSYKILKDALALDITPEVKSMFQNILAQLERAYGIVHMTI
jgi:tetratricopeptide (TPR) repeat protein